VGAGAITEYLVSEGAPLDQKNAIGETALIVAIKSRQQELADLLQRGGADWEYHEDEGAKVSELLVEHGMLTQLERHFRNGANPHVLDGKRENLLHKAAAADWADIVGYLLDLGVATSSKNDYGARPADRAVRESVRQLLSYENNRAPKVFERTSPTATTVSIGSHATSRVPSLAAAANIPPFAGVSALASGASGSVSGT